ncbi:MAG: chorismate synthase [Lachnospiraceae bacterium]|nr:chorismate synthase [Lachnospiraceae bacterium]
MAGSTYGKNFTVTTWGESHGKALGAVIDGCPAGLPLSEGSIQVFLDRRRPGFSPLSTPRKESDLCEILSGVFEGKTTGTPIMIMVRNTDQISKDYSAIASLYRPGHADYTFDAKYGFRDHRGGGRSSGRETIGRVMGGAIASLILNELGIHIHAVVTSDLKEVPEQDSIGGVITCTIKGLPAGVGEPVFDKLDAKLAAACMSIGAVKAIEIGDGTKVASMKGSENNDAFDVDESGHIFTKTNHCGGILGGMSTGGDVVVKAYIKPTPSISCRQQTVTKEGTPTTISVGGRHDVCIAPRAAVVVEAMCAMTVLDLLYENMHARMDRFCSFYAKE